MADKAKAEQIAGEDAKTTIASLRQQLADKAREHRIALALANRFKAQVTDLEVQLVSLQVTAELAKDDA
jgi:hypothetical protein